MPKTFFALCTNLVYDIRSGYQKLTSILVTVWIALEVSLLIANEIKNLDYSLVPNNSKNHRVDRVLSFFLQSAELGLLYPLTRRRVCPPPSNGCQLITYSPILTILVTSLGLYRISSSLSYLFCYFSPSHNVYFLL